MMWVLRATIVAFIVAVVVATSPGIVVQSHTGRWPDTWPEELEPYRSQAKTLEVMHGVHETVHEIRFFDRKKFEQAWPHILELKTKRAPLIIETSPSSYDVSGSSSEAGVRILSSAGGGWSEVQGNRAMVGPPWPEYLRLASGGLPEYVYNDRGRWRPWTDDKQIKASKQRARVDIVLITDGNTVDLNRLELPTDTPIIDRRFRTEADQRALLEKSEPAGREAHAKAE